MSAQKDTSLWEFLQSRNLDSTENLKELSAVLLSDKDALMNAYGWEYESWLNGLPEENYEEFDEDELAYRLLEQEEREFEEKVLSI